jgi:hypothetical protein
MIRASFSKGEDHELEDWNGWIPERRNRPGEQVATRKK